MYICKHYPHMTLTKPSVSHHISLFSQQSPPCPTFFSQAFLAHLPTGWVWKNICIFSSCTTFLGADMQNDLWFATLFCTTLSCIDHSYDIPPIPWLFHHNMYKTTVSTNPRDKNPLYSGFHDIPYSYNYVYSARYSKIVLLPGTISHTDVLNMIKIIT